jgi:hypothetical protein
VKDAVVVEMDCQLGYLLKEVANFDETWVVE